MEMSTTDRISELPNSLLHDIMALSLMTTRDAVLASLLSKRWRNIWASLPHLHFDLSQFGEDEHDKFCNFVEAVLKHRESSYLHTFRLSCVQFHNVDHNISTWRWISYAIKQAVQVLEVEASIDVDLTWAMFKNESLEELSLCIHKNKLGGQLEKLTDDTIYLPRLKKLHLKGDGMCLDDSHFVELLAGCPALEELWLDNIEFFLFATISSASLKRLTIYKCDLDMINAPNLVYFNFCGRPSTLASYHHVLRTPSLTEAEVVLSGTDRDVDECLDRILNDLSIVKKLRLCIQAELEVGDSTAVNWKTKLEGCGRKMKQMADDLLGFMINYRKFLK
ncbi:F-box/RNI-like superfamily protein [Rhynchospora pubera]|uniref:F-box/RNI-like superfamily protein n=1 Tax=Rhynchospora pubera TaxID=906938 RepID=A0AAV8E631_9POAL|nr:F-box/RNI-like superfamily protein [Rhynchospora pubera]